MKCHLAGAFQSTSSGLVADEVTFATTLFYISIGLLRTIDKASHKSSMKSAFEILIDEWGTMGRNRPTVGVLLRLCIKIEAFRAASYISEEILKSTICRHAHMHLPYSQS